MLKKMLAAIDLTVELGGQTYHPELRPGNLVHFEGHFGRSLIDANGETAFGLTELMFLGWSAMKRDGTFSEDFDAFCEQVEDVDLAGEDPKEP